MTAGMLAPEPPTTLALSDDPPILLHVRLGCEPTRLYVPYSTCRR